ncbi:MAG: putative rane protein [Fibrobacteria bacterium]|nr:putative rane protein [Fibrobacteria bacterium]
MPLSMPWLVGLGIAIVLIQMAVLWRLHLPGRRRALPNAAWVDVGWAAGLGVLALLYAAFGPAPGPRRLLLAVLAGAWSFRLAAHLYRDRVAGGREEDKRYGGMRADWREKAPLYFLFVFLGQGVLDVVLALPFLLIAFNTDPVLRAWEWAGAALWLLALLGESLADRQLTAFKSDPSNRARVCKAGLWRYSRHPNYFFEWLIWVSYALIALAAPWGLWAWLSPAILLFLLTRVSGIPLTERYSLESRGEAYRRYQRETSAFIPWWPKKEMMKQE